MPRHVPRQQPSSRQLASPIPCRPARRSRTRRSRPRSRRPPSRRWATTASAEALCPPGRAFRLDQCNGRLSAGVDCLAARLVGRPCLCPVRGAKRSIGGDREALRESLAKSSEPERTGSDERVRRMLLAFTARGSGQGDLARAEWQSMLAQTADSRLRRCPTAPPAGHRENRDLIEYDKPASLE